MVLGFESSERFIGAVDDYEATMASIFADDSKESYDDLTQEEKELVRRKGQLVLEIEHQELDKVLDDPNAPVMAKVFALGRTQHWDRYPSEKRVELFNAFEKELGHSSLELDRLRDIYINFIEQEKIADAVSVGKMYRDVEAIDINDNSIKLSDIVANNKFTILEFWASWCGPCRGEIPNLKKAYAKYNSKGLEIYSISLDENNSQWLKALEQENMIWSNVVDKLGFKGKAAKDYGIMGVPASFLIGQDGKIVAVSDELRGRNLDKTLSKYIK